MAESMTSIPTGEHGLMEVSMVHVCGVTSHVDMFMLLR